MQSQIYRVQYLRRKRPLTIQIILIIKQATHKKRTTFSGQNKEKRKIDRKDTKLIVRKSQFGMKRSQLLFEKKCTHEQFSLSTIMQILEKQKLQSPQQSLKLSFHCQYKNLSLFLELKSYFSNIVKKYCIRILDMQNKLVHASPFCISLLTYVFLLVLFSSKSLFPKILATILGNNDFCFQQSIFREVKLNYLLRIKGIHFEKYVCLQFF
eukprot:TRINITY_DN11030_c0_g2_i5.p1 TRINITY_DN11030_c0_g2~~TRINITY_DN11030_c0_g2_i5.p1  ORF type:complete len:210 (+),score=-20.39 TRINITY_DN11030_c0_g2_i5:736-1365(+)